MKRRVSNSRMSVRAEGVGHPEYTTFGRRAEPQVSGYPRNLHQRYRSFEAGWRAWVDYMHG
ncbi:hypothetical protein HN873_043409, partial [Arachis hypogaea]